MAPATLTLPGPRRSLLWLLVPPLAALPALALEPKWAIFYVVGAFVAVPIALTVRDAKLWIFAACVLSAFNVIKVIADPAGNSEDFLAIGLGAIDLPIVVMMGVALARASSGGAVSVRFTAAAGGIVLIGCAFIGWIIFGAVQSVRPELTVAYIVLYVRMMLGLAALAACCNDAKRLRWGLYGLFLALLAQSVLAVAQYASGSSFGLYAHFEEETTRGRLVRAGGTLNPTVLSEFIGLIAPLVLAMAFTTRKRVGSWALMALFGLAVGASFLTFSRAGVLSIIISSTIVILAAFANPAVPRVRKVVVTAGICAIGAVVGVYFAAAMIARVDAISTEMVGEESRFSQIQQALAMIADSPVTGTGLGLYRLIMGRFGPVLNFPVHNKWLNVTAETGVPGGLLYLGLWISTLWAFVRQARSRTGAERMFFVSAAAAVFATMVNMNTDVYGTGGAPEIALFLIAGLGLGYASRPPEAPSLDEA